MRNEQTKAERFGAPLFLLIAATCIASMLWDGSSIGAYDNIYDQRRLAVLIVGFCAALFLLWTERYTAATRLALIPLALTLLITWFDTKHDPQASDAGAWVLIVYACVAITAATTTFDHKRVIWLSIAAVSVPLSLYAAKIFAVFAITVGTQGLPVDDAALTLGFINKRYFAQVATACLPVLLAVAVTPGLGDAAPRHTVKPALLVQNCLRLRFVAAASCLWIVFHLQLTEATGSLIALSGATVTALLATRNRVAVTYSVCLAIMIAAAYGALQILKVFASPGRTSDAGGMNPLAHEIRHSVSGRTQLWESAITLFRENPLFGAGPGQYAHHSEALFGHPHNSFLMLLSEWGLVGLPIAVLVIFVGLAALRSTLVTVQQHSEPSPLRRNVALGLGVSILAQVAHGMVSGNQVMPMSQLYFCLALGLGIAIGRPALPHWDQTQQRTASAQHRMARLVATGAYLLIAAIAFMTLELSRENSRSDTELAESCRGKLLAAGPSIWEKTIICAPTGPHDNGEFSRQAESTR